MFPFDQANQQQYDQYAQASDSGDYSGIDQDQAAGHVQQFAQNAPPEMQLYGQAFGQMPQDQRAQFVQQLPPRRRGRWTRATRRAWGSRSTNSASNSPTCFSRSGITPWARSLPSALPASRPRRS